MANYTAADVKRLRELTGSGMLDCKNALANNDGDFDKAVEELRIKGAKDVGKRAERPTAEVAQPHQHRPWPRVLARRPQQSIGEMELRRRHKGNAYPADAQQEFGRARGDSATDQQLRQIDENDQPDERRKGTLHRATLQARDVIEYDRSAEDDNDGLQDIIGIAEDVGNVAAGKHNEPTSMAGAMN